MAHTSGTVHPACILCYSTRSVVSQQVRRPSPISRTLISAYTLHSRSEKGEKGSEMPNGLGQVLKHVVRFLTPRGQQSGGVLTTVNAEQVQYAVR